MRVLHVLKTLDPSYGGPQVIATRLAAAQARLGHDVAILSHTRAEAAERVRALWHGLPSGGKVHHEHVPAEALVERLMARQARRHVDSLMPEVNFVHSHGLWNPIQVEANASAHRNQVPYTVALHGSLDPWSLSQKRWKKTIALAIRYRRMLDRAAFVQTSNEDEKRLVEPLSLRRPIEVLPNGVFFEEIERLPDPGRFRAMHPELHGEPYILFLGRLHYKKGLDYLARSFAVLAPRQPRVRLVVAGPDEGARREFERRVARAGLADRVHLVGPIFGTEKLAALAGASCFCLPSRQEGFAVAILEALACRLPVVITEGCHFPEVAEAGAGYVAPLEPQAIADGLDRILSDAELRRSMGEAARRLIASRYTWERVAEQAVALYERYSR